MAARPNYTIADEALSPVQDDHLSALLHEVYVGGGFTDPEVASSVFSAEAVRARGQLLCARDDGGTLVGMVLVVPPDSAARQLATPDQAELHLLAVAGGQRRSGIGEALVRAAFERARASGYTSIVLWTQPTMHAAHRLYERTGFVRSSPEDFERAGRAFQVYRRIL